MACVFIAIWEDTDNANDLYCTYSNYCWGLCVCVCAVSRNEFSDSVCHYTVWQQGINTLYTTSTTVQTWRKHA